MGKSKNAKQNREGLAELTKAFAEPEYIRKQSYAIATVESLIRQYEQRKGAKHKVIDSVSERIKTAASAAEKLERKGYEISYEQAVQRLNDLAGARIVCSFRDEVYQVAEYLIEHPQLTIIKTKDYIKKPKASGYQSVHLIVGMLYPYGEENETVRAEIQIRTVAMNYWAKLDHQLCYKQEKSTPQETEQVRRELLSYAQEIARIDKKMLALRKKIEAM